MTELTIERLFSSPDLNGTLPKSIRFSPDGGRVTWLQGSTEDVERLDLWQFDIKTGERSCLVESRSLGNDRELSDEEKARRERKRIFERGIVEYLWHPSGGSLVFPLDGVLWLYEINAGRAHQLTPDDLFQTDVRFSPDGRWLSFVRNGDLYAMDLTHGSEQRLTHDGGGTVSNGIAEFIAQEEMHRYEGYWWSPDSTRIAFVNVDESTVALTRRFEIEADEVTLHEQRYPFAGEANARVRIGVISVEGESDASWIDTGRDDEHYIARIHWLADNESLAVTIQSRDQQMMECLECRPDEPARVLITETSESWINLDDHFRRLGDRGDFLWGSERSGFLHLYRFDAASGQLNAVTQGEWVVKRVCHIDEQNGLVYFEAAIETPIETHLYVTSLDGSIDASIDDPRRITRSGISHNVTLSKDGRWFLDRYSSPAQPVSVDLCRIDGTVELNVGGGPFTNAHPMFGFTRPPEDIEFGVLHAADGQDLHYRLMSPAGHESGERYPVIVTVYGGPGVQRVHNEWIPPWHHYMASRGYGLFALDNRGSANRGKRFESPIYGQLGEYEVADQLVGADFLSTVPWVDPARIGVFGHSYGGYMTLMLLMRAPEVFRAGVSVAPVTDWHLYDTHYTERYLGHPRENAGGYERSAVFPWLEGPGLAGLNGKLLLIHGMADDNVLFTHTTRLMRALQDAACEFELMTYPGAKHGLAGRATNIHRYTMMNRFFDRTLGAGAS